MTTPVSSTITVSGQSGPVVDVNVTLNITHPFVGDLNAFLVSPSGQRAELFMRVGGNGDNFTNTTLDDQAATRIILGSAPFNGSFRPTGRLSDLVGSNPNGTWRLELADVAAVDAGTLRDWSITVTAGDLVTTTDAAGNYSFANLPADNYRVMEVVPAQFLGVPTRFVQRGTKIHGFDLDPGENATGINFANSILADVAGRVYEDSDGDGVRDAAEAGINAHTGYIDFNNDGVLNRDNAALGTSAVVPIPDRGDVSSTLVVSGVPGPVVDVDIQVWPGRSLSPGPTTSTRTATAWRTPGSRDW